MAQPQPYDRQFNFQDFQAVNPAAPPPGDQVDGELNAAKITLDQILAAIQNLMRDDGALKNGIVTQDSFAPDLSIGFNMRGEWASGVNYIVGDGVFYANKFYRAQTSHLSSVVNRPDVSPASWALLADFTQATSDAIAAKVLAQAAATSASASATIATTKAGEASASATSAVYSAASATSAAVTAGENLAVSAANALAAANSAAAAASFDTSRPKRVVIFGSSNGAGSGASTYSGDPSAANGWASPATSWAGLLKTALQAIDPAWEVINRSISGSTTAQAVSRFRTDVVPHRPSHVIICVHPANDGFDYQAHLRNTETLVQMCEAIGAIPVLRGAYMAPGMTAAQYQGALSLNRQLDLLGRHRIDHMSTLDNGAGAFVGGSTYTGDGLHPNDAGHALFFDAIDLGIFARGAARRSPAPARTASWKNASVGGAGTGILIAASTGLLGAGLKSWTMRARVAGPGESARSFLCAYAQGAIGAALPVRVRNGAGPYDVWDSAGAYTLSGITTNPTTDPVTHDLVLSYNAATNSLTFYIDGVAVGTPAGTLSGMGPAKEFVFGGRGDAGAAASGYTFADLGLWATCLRPETIADMAATGFKPAASMLFDGDLTGAPGATVPNVIGTGLLPGIGTAPWALQDNRPGSIPALSVTPGTLALVDTSNMVWNSNFEINGAPSAETWFPDAAASVVATGAGSALGRFCLTSSSADTLGLSRRFPVRPNGQLLVEFMYNTTRTGDASIWVVVYDKAGTVLTNYTLAAANANVKGADALYTGRSAVLPAGAYEAQLYPYCSPAGGLPFSIGRVKALQTIPLAGLADASAASIVGATAAGAHADLTGAQARGVLGLATTDTPTFQGLNVGAAGHGSVRLVDGAASNMGFIEWRKADGTRLGYQGWDNTDLKVILENNARFMVSGGAVVLSSTIAIGSYTVATLPTVGTAGRIAYASNGRAYDGAGGVEGAGVGTGCHVTDNGSNWRIIGTKLNVQA